MQKCQINDDKCVTEVAHYLFKKASQGDPELGLISVDPLFVEHMVFTQNSNGVSLTATTKNINVRGISKAQISKLSFVNGKMDMQFKSPLLTMEGQYKQDGKLLGIALHGEGTMKVNFGKGLLL